MSNQQPERIGEHEKKLAEMKDAPTPPTVEAEPEDEAETDDKQAKKKGKK